MNCNQDFIDIIENFNDFVNRITIEEFAEYMGKNPLQAHTDCWVVEKYGKLKKTPLGLFLSFDRGYQALLMRAITGKPVKCIDKKIWFYEHYEKEINAFVYLDYTIEAESYGEDSDGNRGELRTHVTIDDYDFYIQGIKVTDYFDASEYNPREDDALLEKILEHSKS